MVKFKIIKNAPFKRNYSLSAYAYNLKIKKKPIAETKNYLLSEIDTFDKKTGEIQKDYEITSKKGIIKHRLTLEKYSRPKAIREFKKTSKRLDKKF